MASQCDTSPVSQGPLAVTQTSTSTGATTANVATLPTLDLSSIAMYPIIIGYGILGTIGALGLIFLAGYLTNNAGITDKWSLFIWSSLIILLVSLAIINTSYNRMLSTMRMCKASITTMLQTCMTSLAVATILLCYILYYDFGTNQNIRQYLLFMLHVNLLTSIINLCMVTMQQLSTANKIDSMRRA
jgi:hypothetical protein